MNQMQNPIALQQQGYRLLIELCSADPNRSKLIEFVNSLRDYNGDPDFYTTLNFVKDYLDRHKMNLIIALDWKEEVSELESRLSAVLRENFNTSFELPDAESYGDTATVSSKNVFKDYDSALKKHNFKVGFIDTNSDEYVIVVHRLADESVIRDSVNKIGYPYLNADDRKISS